MNITLQSIPVMAPLQMLLREHRSITSVSNSYSTVAIYRIYY